MKSVFRLGDPPRPLCFLLAFSLLGLTACPTGEKTKKPRVPVVEDPWDKAPHSDEWLHATRESQSGHETECKAVLPFIDGEEKCTAKLCVHGRDLAKDWLSRCPKYLEDDEANVKERLRSFEKSAREDETECGAEAERMLGDGCGKEDKSCKATLERWATSCGGSDGSPLVLRMIERAVERRAGEKITIDTRSCKDLFADVQAGAGCKNQFECEDALKKVDVYTARCGADGDGPGLAGAVLTIAIGHGAGKVPAPVSAKPKLLTARDLATALDDGTGGAIAVCDERVFDLAKYVARRKGCQNGTIAYAKGFKKGDKVEVRLGVLPFADDATFALRFPSLALDGEAELRDAQQIAAFEAELGKIAESVRGGNATPDSVARLVRAIRSNARSLSRPNAPAFREALMAKDAQLIPVLRELGKAKALAAKGKLTVAELAGFHARSQRRAFADVTREGVVEPGASSRAAELDTLDLLPRSMVVYLETYKPAFAIAKAKKVDTKTAAMARAYGKIQASACGAAEKKLNDAESGAVACAFGVVPCDPTKLAAAIKEIDDARRAAETARHQLDMAMTSSPPQTRDELTQLATTAGCIEPWW